jgi:hypothetical protein
MKDLKNLIPDEETAIAYNEAAIKYFREYAELN